MSAAEVAQDHASARRRLALVAADEAARQWARVDPGRIAASWLELLPRLLVLLTGAQQSVAGRADGYLDEVLAEQRVSARAEGRVSAAALAGVASDGRDLADLLYQPAISALVGIKRGATVDEALAGGGASLDMLVRTQVADAGRVADQVALVARPQATGYVRMLVGKSCSRCAILAGRRYGWSAGFQRHPRCLPAGVVVSGPATLAATRRWYQGELVVLTTASGQELPITGNHPVLTDRGWLPANFIEEGDHVVRSTFAQGASALTVPDEDQVPSRVEDLWRPGGVMPLLQMPTAAEDFHGDGGHGDVDVVLTDRLLRDRREAALSQHVLHELVAGGVVGAPFLPLPGPRNHELFGVAPTAVCSHIRRLGYQLAAGLAGLAGHRLGGWSPCVSGSLGLSAALLRGHLRGADLAGLRVAPDADAEDIQSAADDVSADAVAGAEAQFALTGGVGGGDLGVGKAHLAARWDAPAGPLTVESRSAYAESGQDLLLRLAGQVELDRVVERRRVEWSGHVYNLTSVEGWYSANGLIVSNCDCVHIPAREDSADDLRTDPKKYFASLSAAEQDRLFTVGGAEAIRAGADIAQVVNARKGMYEAGGRQFTRTGTRRRKRPRLMPEQILREAGGDRAEALRLLKLHNYLR
ncbi:hypothetical protein [Micromonospora carbonacea]|uniref:hypothetical protein n=1 Tax=Micromonospora carbonacea TaxID=47853 RepID=UPI00114CAD27|nr:hypothetical protein [Micromonospora carbonacea]